VGNQVQVAAPEYFVGGTCTFMDGVKPLKATSTVQLNLVIMKFHCTEL